ncbi:hypothetical protein W97_06247 [Coniosporium apollinis CBS 100218]|uniref:Uncharacterized protein n=1 Tax=Coniosporium apollinis (strain CBS 100218) TaxID=1168221 RepID=R7YY21_CONA1|nr:uncharacterized protein W97_06247 [Coniosporium apollinis CBS 100218]EON66845.1 hypothetical protein W97_06247 [Coniosporium apollinis CBS 100218]
MSASPSHFPRVLKIVHNDNEDKASSTVSTLPAQPFPFMDLPAELRLYTYNFCLWRSLALLLPQLAPMDNSAVAASAQSGTILQQGQQQQLQAGAGASSPPSTEPTNTEPLMPALLRVSKAIYTEAKPVLDKNTFFVPLDSVKGMRQLPQRTRSLIKHARIAIPTRAEVFGPGGFMLAVRQGLRYCFGLQTLTIKMPAVWSVNVGTTD